MRVQIGNVLLKDLRGHERHSYVDAADDILALPANVLNVSFGRVRRPSWPEDCTKEDLRKFLLDARALAMHI